MIIVKRVDFLVKSGIRTNLSDLYLEFERVRCYMC
jgi:hypothetical protein